MQNSNRKATAVGLVWTLMVVAVVGVGCATSKKQKKEPKKKKVEKKTRMEKLAERTGLEQKALKKFERALEEQSSEKPDNQKIKNLLVDVVETEPKFAEAHYNLGVLYSDLDQPAKAVRHLQKAHDLAPGKLDYTVALAQAYATDEQYSKARDLFQEVVARQPNNLTAKNNLAVMALRQGDRKAALQHVRDVLREDKKNVGALNVLGLIYRKKGNLSLAKYAFQKALEVGGESADIHNNLGLVYLKENDVPSAVDQFVSAVEADPNYLESRLNVGAIFLEYLDYDRAYKQFKEAVRIAPNNCTARLGKGATSFAKGKHKLAAKNFQYYVDECDAKHLSSYERLANLYQNHLGDKEKALSYYDKLLNLCEKKKKCASYKATRRFLAKQIKSSKQQEPDKSEKSPDSSKKSKESEKSSSKSNEGASKGEKGGESESSKRKKKREKEKRKEGGSDKTGESGG